MGRFNIENEGYNKGEVNQFVIDISNKINNLIDKTNIQSQEIERLRKKLENYNDINESEIIINNAKINASRIINDSLLEAKKIEENKKILEENIVIIKRKLKNILNQQIDTINELDKIKLDSE